MTKTRKGKKHKHKHYTMRNKTPKKINKIVKQLANILPVDGLLINKDSALLSSYSPTINKELVTLTTDIREPLYDCNNDAAFKLKEPLKISIPGLVYGRNCYNYDTPQAKKFLLKNLAANKHVNPKKIVPPAQIQSNCWFNAMFVSFFVSDKGRKFFHFFRQLMIEGKQHDGTIIPPKLRDAFALLNFGVDAALSGNSYAYKLNTNSIIHQIYTSIPTSYKQLSPFIIDIDEPGNPLLYYISIINYLNNKAILVIFLRDVDSEWKKLLEKVMNEVGHMPHIVVLEVFDNKASLFNKKPMTFKIADEKYKLDSAVVRDKSKQHFCTMITAEGEEMAYDGMSFHRLVSLDWKNKLNSKDFNWRFEGTNDNDGQLLEWNFTECYQLLMYYRV
jgi:hypothetical protein